MCHHFTLPQLRFESHRRVHLKGEFKFQCVAAVSFYIVPLLSAHTVEGKTRGVSVLLASIPWETWFMCVHVVVTFVAQRV